MKTLVTIVNTMGNMESGDTGYIDGYVREEDNDHIRCIVVITSTTPQKMGAVRLENVTPTGILNTVSLS